MTPEFNEWWQGELDDIDNPYRVDSPAYWAYAGWVAAQKHQWVEGKTSAIVQQKADNRPKWRNLNLCDND